MFSRTTTLAAAKPSALLASVLVLAAMALPTSVGAFSRDSDGTRLQARFHRLGSTASDSLRPPADRADWRMVKLKRAGVLSVRVTHSPRKGPVSITLVSSSGRQLASATTRGGSASFSRKVERGFYYVSVAGRAATSYSVTIR